MGITLRAARANKSLNQKEAAKLIGISVETLANYEKAKSFPDVPVIMKIEKAYGLRYSDIVFYPKITPKA